MSSKCFNCLDSEHPSIVSSFSSFVHVLTFTISDTQSHIVQIGNFMYCTLHCWYTARKVFSIKEYICNVLFCLVGVVWLLFVSYKRFPWQNMLHAVTTCERRTSYRALSKGHTFVGKLNAKGKCQPSTQNTLNRQTPSHKTLKRHGNFCFCNKQFILHG